MITDEGKNEQHFLVVLDFDDTIVEGNSEESVKSLLESRDIQFPCSMVNHYEKHKDWNYYINLLYEFLHENDIKQKDIVDSLHKISFVKGQIRVFSNNFSVYIYFILFLRIQKRPVHHF